MPCYPALALLLGSAMAMGGDWVRRGTRALAIVSACAALVIAAILIHLRGIPTPGDISPALSHHPKAYTLSLGHMQDLTLRFLRILARAACSRRNRVLHWRAGHVASRRRARVPCRRIDDDSVFSSRAARHGHVRSVPFFPAARGDPAERARRNVDRSGFLLPVLLRLLLSEPHRLASLRQTRQPRIRLPRPRRAPKSSSWIRSCPIYGISRSGTTY